MKKIIEISILLLLVFSNKAYSLIEIDITRGNLDPLPIAVSPLSTDEKSQKEFKNDLKIDNMGSKEVIEKVKQEVKGLCSLFPVYNK